MKSDERISVLIIGERYIENELFIQRALTPLFIDLAQLHDKHLLDEAKAILFCLPPGKFRLLEEYFEKSFASMCNRGLLTVIYTEDHSQVSQLKDVAYSRLKKCERVTDTDWAKWIKELVWVHNSGDCNNILQRIVSHIPGPSMGNPEIEYLEPKNEASDEADLLIRRAFHDSEKIVIKRLDGGKTAKGAFCVFSTLKNHQFGRHPMPFFVKLDIGFRIQNEIEQYERIADPFIPFYLRPSFSSHRSLIGLHYGVLVGSFVDNAVSLRAALKAGQGSGVIFSLFETTLKALRTHTIASPKNDGAIEAFLSSKVRAEEVASKHPKRLTELKTYYATAHPEEMHKILISRSKMIPARQGPYHGDLHYSNIMVRNRDAILIDLGSMGPFGPLSADPAILEVSLVFGADNDDDPESFNRWRRFVDAMYIDPLVPPIDDGAFHQFDWLHRAIRELRHIVLCCCLEKAEVLTVLAGSLLRFGRNTSLGLSSQGLDILAEKKRAYALVVAYKICEMLERP